MPNPNPTQSEEFCRKRLQRVTLENSIIPEGTELAEKTIGIRLPVKVDKAIRTLDKQKAAWLREVICLAALDENLVDTIA